MPEDIGEGSWINDLPLASIALTAGKGWRLGNGCRLEISVHGPHVVCRTSYSALHLFMMSLDLSWSNIQGLEGHCDDDSAE